VRATTPPDDSTERTRERPRVGVVGVQVRQERERNRPRLGPRQRRSRLADESRHRVDVLEQIDNRGTAARPDLQPAQPSRRIRI
jgi:hypothetical protein